MFGKDKNVKVPTGIEGLDKALEGGIPESNIVLLSGGCGTGKSTFCLQFLVNGALKYKEKGLYISTEQNEDELSRAASQFGWDLEELEKKKMLKIVHFDVVEGDDFLGRIYDIASGFGPKRIAVDSLTTFTDSLLVSNKEDKPYTFAKIATTVSPVPTTERIVVKSALYHLIKKLKLFKATVLMTSELPEKSDFLSADELSEFICDGVLILKVMTVGDSVVRTLEIKKMRYCAILGGAKTFEFCPSGIILT